MDLECIPTMVRITKDNIHSAKTEDKKHLHSVVVRIQYSSTRYLFLCYNPYDGALKSIWFTDKINKNEIRVREQEDGEYHKPPV